MRYNFDSRPEHASEIGAQISRWSRENKIIIITRGDTLGLMRADMEKMKNAFLLLQKSGINEDVLITYLKGRGFSMTVIKDVLYYQKEFFKKLGVMK